VIKKISVNVTITCNDSVRSYDHVRIGTQTVQAALSSSYSNALKVNVVILTGVDFQTRELEIVTKAANDKRVTRNS
jgi:hypothetical protein